MNVPPVSVPDLPSSPPASADEAVDVPFADVLERVLSETANPQGSSPGGDETSAPEQFLAEPDGSTTPSSLAPVLEVGVSTGSVLSSVTGPASAALDGAVTAVTPAVLDGSPTAAAPAGAAETAAPARVDSSGFSDAPVPAAPSASPAQSRTSSPVTPVQALQPALSSSSGIDELVASPPGAPVERAQPALSSNASTVTPVAPESLAPGEAAHPSLSLSTSIVTPVAPGPLAAVASGAAAPPPMAPVPPVSAPVSALSTAPLLPGSGALAPTAEAPLASSAPPASPIPVSTVPASTPSNESPVLSALPELAHEQTGSAPGGGAGSFTGGESSLPPGPTPAALPESAGEPTADLDGTWAGAAAPAFAAARALSGPAPAAPPVPASAVAPVAVALATSGGQVTLTLSPEGLGPLTLQVRRTSEGVVVVLRASADALAAVGRSAIVDALVSNGFSPARVDLVPVTPPSGEAPQPDRQPGDSGSARQDAGRDASARDREAEPDEFVLPEPSEETQ